MILGLAGLMTQLSLAQTTLVSTGAVWKYLDDGSDPGMAWQSPAFDDSLWLEGSAQLGYGDGDEATVINGGPPTNRIITYYFRQQFDVPDPAGITNLVLRLMRDDGGIVYLNGVEVFRSNMLPGPTDYQTWAATVVPNGPQESEFYSTQVDPALLAPGPNLLAVEIHQANNTSSDVSFDLELIPNVPPAPPIVTITSFTSQTNALVAPGSLDIKVEATDYDSTVSRVDFFLDNTWLGASATEPFGLSVSNIAAGQYALRALAMDGSGMVGTSPPVVVTVLGEPMMTTLIATGSVWKYLDTGPINPIPAWRFPLFDDTSWPSGPAILGYGGAAKSPPRPEATTINCCGLTGTKYMADYFRRAFVVPNASIFTNLYFRVLRDDGLVVYLNGSELFRMNITNEIVTSGSTSATIVGGTNETFRFPTNVPPGLLVTGTNVLAVELHQSGPNTTDAAFDLELIGIGPPPANSLAITITNSGSELLVTWTAIGVSLEKADTPLGPWAKVTTAIASPYRPPPSETCKFYRLRQP